MLLNTSDELSSRPGCQTRLHVTLSGLRLCPSNPWTCHTTTTWHHGMGDLALGLLCFLTHQILQKKWIAGEKVTVCFREKFHFIRSGIALCPFSQRSRRFGLEKPYHQTNHEISTHFFIFGSSAPLIADLLLACSLPCNLIKTLWDSGGDTVEGTDQFVLFFSAPWHPDFSLHHLPNMEFFSSVIFFHLILHKLTYRSFATDFRKNLISFLETQAGTSPELQSPPAPLSRGKDEWLTANTVNNPI